MAFNAPSLGSVPICLGDPLSVPSGIWAICLLAPFAPSVDQSQPPGAQSVKGRVRFGGEGERTHISRACRGQTETRNACWVKEVR